MSRFIPLFSRTLMGSLLLATTVGDAGAADKSVIGWIERVSLTSQALILDAKVDTGADFSSVHAEDIRYFMRDGARWVEFVLHDRSGRKYVLHKPLERMARIKKKTTGFQERPVVMLQLCIGGSERSVQVNLAQRGHFKYPLLLGRNFLSEHYLVDAGAKHLLNPSCPPSSP